MEVFTFKNTEQLPGDYNIVFDASELSSGIYFYKLQVYNFAIKRVFTSIRKMIMMK